MRSLLISMASLGLTASALIAQAPPRQSMVAQPWWQNQPAINSLNLSDAQTKQLAQIQSASVSRLRYLYAAVKTADSNLEDIYNQPTFDDLKAQAAVDQYANARDNLTRELTGMSLKMRGVLTAEQWQELEDRQNGRAAARPGRGGGRRGGTQPPTAAPSKVGPAISQK